MEHEKIRAAYDSILPDEETKERMLDRILAASGSVQERKEIPMKKRRFVLIPLAAALTLALAVTAAATGALDTFGLWLGGEKIELDALTPVPVDADRFRAYALDHAPGDWDGVSELWDGMDAGRSWAAMPDGAAFEEATGVVLPEDDALHLTDIHLDLWPPYGHLSMEVGLDGQTCHMNGMFLTAVEADTVYGYGVEGRSALSVYRYAPDRAAYLVRDRDGGMDQMYFVEGGIMYQLFVERTPEGADLARAVVDHMAGVR